MLSELRIENFAIIDKLHLQFAAGFNSLTGETGAGKSIILDAVALLLGGRADTDIVRSGAGVAQVEGIFKLGKREAVRIASLLEREGLEADTPDMLVLAREIRKGGRSLTRVNGRTVTLAVLKEISTGLIDIHGQSEHLSLLNPASHLDLLDRYAGLESQREQFAALVREVNAVSRELTNLLSSQADLARRAELLAYEVEEIGVARLKAGEEDSLREERTRLANAEQLSELTDVVYNALYMEGADGQLSAADLVGEAVGALMRLAQIDKDLQNQYNLAEDIATQIEELARDVRNYSDNVEFDSTALAQAEERLNLINTLKRKYKCETVAELLLHAEAAAREMESIEGSEERIAQLEAEQERLLQRVGSEGASLSSARLAASDKMAASIEAELSELKMEGARFAVSIEPVEDPNGAYLGDFRVAFDETGIDSVEFLIAPNVGEPLMPMARIASGGETARLMLALKSALSSADYTPTLIFDEIDQGIGGRIGAVVGFKLWNLASHHQVMVVTHLPQLAGFADAHYKVEKHVSGNRTVTSVEPLNKNARIDELAEMLGTEAESAHQNAQEILEYVKQAKKNKSVAVAT